MRSIIILFACFIAATGCNKDVHTEGVDLGSQPSDDIAVSGNQPVTSDDALGSNSTPSSDVPKVRCDYSVINEFGTRSGTCLEYFVGPEESLQLDKAAELEATCSANGGVWDFDGCVDEDNIAGVCATPLSELEPAMNEVFYREADAKDEDPSKNCAAPATWIKNP
jgi:hypothetical protein